MLKDTSREAIGKEAQFYLGEQGEETAWSNLKGGQSVRSIGKLKPMMREMLADKLGEVEEWVELLLHTGER